MPGPRELIEPHSGDKRYQQRKKDGSFGPADNVTKSLRQDVKHKAKTIVKVGYGDEGDQMKK